MRMSQIEEAIENARRFIKKAEAVKDLASVEDPDDNDPRYVGGKHTAALKRASMDLSSSLVELRKY